MGTAPTAFQVAAMLAASFGGGAMNAIAGGGTILTFPVLLLLGLPAVAANATSTVALVPGAAASMWGYRREVETHRRWLRVLLVPSVLGGAIGSMLLLRTPEAWFRWLAPWLVLFATGLFLAQAVMQRRAVSPSGTPDDVSSPAGSVVEAAPELPAGARRIMVLAAPLAVAIYGGYFGAGLGILMLAVLGSMGLSDIHAMNGLKNFFGICINLVAAAWFVLNDAVIWPLALVMTVGSIAGGYAGARLARSIGRERVRVAVVAIGVAAAAALLVKA